MKAKKQYGFEPDYAIPPGETLLDVINAQDMTQRELVIRTGLSVQSINRIIKNAQPITYETANRLELATGVSAKFWNNLEAQYREQLAKLEEKQRLEQDLEWLKTIPTKELIERGTIKSHQDKVLSLRETLKFYGVSSVSAYKEIWAEPAVAARRSKCFESSPGPTSAWIRMGEIQAIQIDCAPFNRPLFAEAVKRIRELTLKTPAEFVPQMKKLCAKAGVALSLVPEMKKVPWLGATKWLSAGKAMILLNLRGKSEDKFWFSFFHEAGHVLHDSPKDIYINDENRSDIREKKADKFAARELIPPEYNEEIRQLKSYHQVEQLSVRLKIAPGIVVGRYQFLTDKWNMFNKLKQRFEWSDKMETK